MRRPGQGIAELLAEAVRPAAECWVPPSLDRTSDGYSRVSLNGSSVLAHRVMYERLVGPVPTGLELDHLCRNRACVNPAHLEPVTHAENVRRSAKTHCSRGHALAETAISITGRRQWCRVCRRDRDLELRAKRGPLPPRRVSGMGAIWAARTTCNNGHPFDEVIKGARSCSICRLARGRAYHARHSAVAA